MEDLNVRNEIRRSNYKLSDEDFWQALRVNGGIFARAAKYIQNKYGIHYSRQAVQKRATANAKALAELEDLIEEAIDIAEEALFALIRTGQPATRLEAIKFYLKYQGKHRGYGDKPVEVAAKVSSNDATNNMETLRLTIKVIG